MTLETKTSNLSAVRKVWVDDTSNAIVSRIVGICTYNSWNLVIMQIITTIKCFCTKPQHHPVLLTNLIFTFLPFLQNCPTSRSPHPLQTWGCRSHVLNFFDSLSSIGSTRDMVTFPYLTKSAFVDCTTSVVILRTCE